MKRLKKADTIYNFSIVGNYKVAVYSLNSSDEKVISPEELDDDLFMKMIEFIESEFEKVKDTFKNDIQGICQEGEMVTNVNFVLGTEKSNLNIICNKRFSIETKNKVLDYVKLNYYNGWGDFIETHEFERDDNNVYYVHLLPSNANLRIS